MKPPAVFKRARSPRACLETSLLGVLVIGGLLGIGGAWPSPVLGQGILFSTGGIALWHALRLALPQGSLFRKVAFETLHTMFVSLFLGVALPFIMGLLGLRETLYSTKFTISIDFVLLSGGIMFVVLRMGVYAWTAWNRLRVRRLVWSLVHTQLTVVVIVALLLVAAGSIYILQEANLNFPGQEDLSATLASRLFRTLLPYLGITTLLTLIVLAAILPPSALVAYLYARRITRRLESLTSTASQLRGGDYRARVPVSGQDEVAQLQSDFNAMAAELEDTLGKLQAERDKVAALLESRRQLTASVSHELRTPLATLRGYLEPALARRDEISPERLHRDLHIVENELGRLERLIDDLLTLARSELRGLDLHLQPVDALHVARRMVETFAPLAWEQGRVEVLAQGGTDIPPALADPTRLEQILSNLLRNAIRHTPPGGIVALTVTTQGDQVQIQVGDTGEGIPPEDLPHIWERFYPVGEGEPTRRAGTGLGLALVKELTEAMGGSVAVESALGEGSTFSIYLPQA